MIIAVAAISVVVVVSAVVAWTSGWRRESLVTAFVWFGVVAGTRIGQVLSIPRQARRVFRQQRGLQLPCELSWNTEGLTASAEDGVATTRWRDFHRAVELDRQFVLFFSDAAFMMIPKRSFPDVALLEDFRNQVSTAVAKH